MKSKLLVSVIFISVLFGACSQDGTNGPIKKNDLKTNLDSVSYMLGADIADKLKQSGLEKLNTPAFVEGLRTVLEGDSARINPAKEGGKINAFFQKLHEQKLAKNKKEGEDFLAANKSKEGVKVTESGLQYKVMKEGNGKIPNDSSIVKVHYHGTLIDGTVFDSSVDKGEPVEFPVNGVIKGWQEVLQLMPVGSKWKVFIPTELAYGRNVRPGGPIEPNMALIFEIELLDIIPPQKKDESKK